MTISDSIPVQFWLIGVESFNEKQVCGLIIQECFCQPFNCDDDIVIQFLDDVIFNYELRVYDIDTTLISANDFAEVTNGVWQATINFNQSPCAQKVYFVIRRQEQFGNGDLGYPIGGNNEENNNWYYMGDGGLGIWVHSSYAGDLAAYITLTTTSSASPKTLIALRHKFNQIVYTPRTFNFSFRSGSRSASLGSWTGGNVKAVYYFQGVEIGTQTIQGTLGPDTTYSGSFDTAFAGFDTIGIRVAWTSTGSPFSGTNEFFVLLFEMATSFQNEDLAKSDCIDVQESHGCTKLIEYENTANFDNVNYLAGSPGPTFKIRIPAIFEEEKNPQEQEDLELSNGEIVTLRSTIQEKRLLDIGFLPNYMIRKIQKILMHDVVTIDGDRWRKRDAFNDNPIDKYNLKRSNVLLTKYNSVQKNTI